MKPSTAHFFLTLLGWKAVEPPVPEPKCVILGVPHTSIWDFIISYFYYTSVGGRARIMIKKEFFKGPLKKLLLSLGAIPVDRSRAGGATLVKQMLEAFEKNETLHLSIAPEGTRKRVDKWKTGFHYIARAANVPLYLGYFDWKTKTIGRGEKFILTDDVQGDLKKIRQYYKDKGVVAKHPENFSTGKDLE